MKNNVVIPWLRRMGIDPGETSFEGSFTLQLGHNQVVVGAKKKRTAQVGGRYDTLIKRNDQNLLIVEFKAGGLPLDDSDRDQAVSYARLLRQIAPYALVTNGKDFQLFNVENLERCAAIQLKDRYHLSLPEDLIAQAQELFLNLSLENLLAFCEAQVTAQLKALSGSPSDLAKKYVSELTVPRLVIDSWITKWDSGSEPGLLVLADSGRGKTSAFCDLARRRLAEDKPTLLFSAGALEGSLLEAIAVEFNWVFTEQASPPHLIKRLGRITSDRRLLIVVDAVDEWLYPQRAASLLNFLRGVSGLGVKVLFSCKTNAWPGFRAPAGQDLGIDAFVHRPSDLSDPTAHHLPALNDSEFIDAVQRYRDAFGVRGRFESAALSEARRNPFVLRVLFSVAAHRRAESLSFSLKDFFERYYEVVLQRTGQRDVADAQLLALARACDAGNRPVLTMDEVRTALALPITDSLLPELFEQDVLQRTSNGITFYFQNLRDYLIAFRVRNWPQLPPEDFARTRVQGVAAEAFNFYLRYASTEQMRTLCGPAFANAERYVALYDELLDRHFPRLRDEFEPREKGAVGFIAEYVTGHRSIGGYGFRIREPGEPAVLLVPVDEFFSKSNLLAIHGATSLYHCSSANGFMLTDVPHEVVEHEIVRQMKTILDERRLLMSTATVVPQEAFVATVEAAPQYFAHLYDRDIRRVQYPLTAAKLRACFERVKLANHFRSEIAAEKAAALSRTSGRYRSVSLTRDDEIEVLRRTEIALTDRRPIKFRSLVTNVRDLEEFLARVGAFDLKDEITGPVWPNDFDLAELLRAKPNEGQRELEAYIGNFFCAFLRDYRTVIEENFPRLKSSFMLYSNLPVRLYIEVRPRLDGHHITGQLSILGVRLPSGSGDETAVCGPGELDRQREKLRSEATEQDFLDGSERLDGFIPWRKGSTPLQDQIYRWIGREWPAAADVIRRENGLQPKRLF